MDQISGWECKSDLEFEVDTKNKYYPFLQELSFIRPLRMLSPSAFANDADPLTSNSCHVGWGTVEDEDTTVVCAGITAISGTGPFMFESRATEDLDEETTVDNEVVFKANPTYWDGASDIETLIIKRYEDSDAVKKALLEGNLDIVWGSGVLPADDLIELDEDETNSISVFHSDDIQNVIILLNSGKAPLDDINVRKTVIHAINKKKIIDDNLGGLFKPVDNVFPRDAPYCDVDITPRWDYDLEKAEFLNCAPKSNSGLAVGLGVGLGLVALILGFVAFGAINKSRQLESELEELKVKEGAVKA
jgi:nickel transport system substrate-binding protein